MGKITKSSMGLQEFRIYDGVDREKLSSNWSEVQENERLVDAWCEKHGVSRPDQSEPYAVRMKFFDETLERAKHEGL